MTITAALLALPGFAQTNSVEHPDVLIVVGAAGEPEFAGKFLAQATAWQNACTQAAVRPLTIGLDSAQTNDYEQFKAALEAEPKDGPSPLWLVMIGHGTFDGKNARFNLRGPDVSASDLADWLHGFHRPLIVLDTASSSAPFLSKLSATNRVVITATRSGHEQNFTRFGEYLSECINDPAADLDKDGAVSLLEAFLVASRRTAEFYKTEGRLATEHALLDDNGDGLGTPADWFEGLRATKKPKDSGAVDGFVARQIFLVPSKEDQALTADQRAKRDALERSVLLHRERKGQIPEADYYRDLEKLLLELARLHFPEMSK